MRVDTLKVIMTSFFITAAFLSKKEKEVYFVFDSKAKNDGSVNVKVEFIEDNEAQNYLDVITFRDRFILDMYKLNIDLRLSNLDTNPKNSYECPKQILENFGLDALKTPVITPIGSKYCKNMRQTCCLQNDIEILEKVWENSYSPKIKYFQYYFKYYINKILHHHERFRLIANEISHNHKNHYCKTNAKLFLEMEIDEDFIEKTKKLLKDFLNFDYKLKRGFMCALCDYENLGGFDFKTNLQAYHHNFCQNIVEHSIDFQHYMNKIIYKYINSVNVLATCKKTIVNAYNDTVVQSNDSVFLEIDNNQFNEICHHAKQNGLNTFLNCLTYCSRYKIWRMEEPTYRKLDVLVKIHENVNNYLLDKKDDIIVDNPKNIAIDWVIEPKREALDIFTTWEIVFSDKFGAKFEHLTDISTEDY